MFSTTYFTIYFHLLKTSFLFGYRTKKSEKKNYRGAVLKCSLIVIIDEESRLRKSADLSSFNWRTAQSNRTDRAAGESSRFLSPPRIISHSFLFFLQWHANFAHYLFPLRDVDSFVPTTPFVYRIRFIYRSNHNGLNFSENFFNHHS